MFKINKVTYTIICVITIIQIYLYFKEDNKTIEVTSGNIIKTKENFKEIDEELNKIKKLEVLELKDNGEMWNGKILLSGTKKELLESIELLNYYNITNYKIDGNANEFQVLLDICR